MSFADVKFPWDYTDEEIEDEKTLIGAKALTESQSGRDLIHIMM